MEFASDNTSGVAPQIMAALGAANEGYRGGYGGDEITARVEAAMDAVFACETATFLVPAGSASNSLALACLTPPWGVIFAHATAHIQVDEAGAPHLFTHGAKIQPVAGDMGRMTPVALTRAMALYERGVVHSPQPAALSLTQVTEWGTVYDHDTLAELTGMAHRAGLKVHMDGARFANAVAALGCHPADITWKAGVDVLVFGATKNGAMAAEAVVFFDRDLARDFHFRRKQAGHLLSKHRFIAAQMEAYLADDLWLDLARNANAMAARLGQGLTAAGIPLAAPVEANEVFPIMTDALAESLRAAGAHFYDWPYGAPGVRRLVTSWCTADADVDAFLSVLRTSGTVAA